MCKILGIRMKKMDRVPEGRQLAFQGGKLLLILQFNQRPFAEFNMQCSEYISFILGSVNKTVSPEMRADTSG